MVASANLGLRDVPVKRWLEDRFGLRVEVDNDVHAATLAELGLGAGRTFRDFVYVNVGTGIAAGLVIDGRLCRGVANLAGEFGHVTVDRDGIPCHCGQKGCLEELAAGPRIVERYRKLRGGAPPVGTASGVFDLAAAGDAAAGAVLEAVTEDIGTGIVNLANLLNPEAVVLGGGVFRGSGVLAARIAAFVRARALREIAACLRSVDVSALEPGSVGILGAASLGWEIVKESQ
jgi:glucokinase